MRRAGQENGAAIPFHSFTAESFREFNENGWGKIAWSISVEPYLDGSTICLELRTTVHETVEMVLAVEADRWDIDTITAWYRQLTVPLSSTSAQ